MNFAWNDTLVGVKRVHAFMYQLCAIISYKMASFVIGPSF